MSHTLLLADDSVTIQRVIELTFADEDVNVVAVSDGDEAIAVLDKAPPDIVLADVGMPGRNGYEVAQHIRDTPRLAHIPVVLLTGAFEPIDQAKASAAGCDGVLAKPFEPQLVIGRVKELLSKPKQSASLDAALPPPSAGVTWRPSFADVEPRAVSSPGEAGDYFDRLDQAFANLSAPPADASRPNVSGPGATALDWFASQPPPADVVQSRRFNAMPGRAFEPAESRSVSTRPDRWEAPQSPAPNPVSYAAVPPPPPPPPISPPAPLPTLPPLADAFAALLAAEQASPLRQAAPMWQTLPQSAGAGTALSDDVIRQVAQRVIDQLTDRVIRETVAEKVSEVAERLIREEIERIKASIK